MFLWCCFIHVTLILHLVPWLCQGEHPENGTLPEKKLLSSGGSFCNGPCELYEEGEDLYYRCRLNWGFDFCSPEDGFDYFWRKCTSPCEFTGQKDRKGKRSCSVKGRDWGYCSTVENVKKLSVQYTIRGEKCSRPCRPGKKGYECGENKWCSAYEGYSIRGYKCVDACKKRGSDYYWCNIVGGSWESCSPPHL